MSDSAEGFVLDTSGEVLVQRATSGGPFTYLWSDLSPFTQGYIDALLRTASERTMASSGIACVGFNFGFSRLSPSALELIIRDCEAMAKRPETQATWYNGKQFWFIRNQGTWADFPPLRITLSETGKVELTHG